MLVVVGGGGEGSRCGGGAQVGELVLLGGNSCHLHRVLHTCSFTSLNWQVFFCSFLTVTVVPC